MYIIYDHYEGTEIVGKYDDWFDMQKAKKEYIADTDGECDLEIVFIDMEQ